MFINAVLLIVKFLREKEKKEKKNRPADAYKTMLNYQRRRKTSLCEHDILHAVFGGRCSWRN